MFEDFQDHVEEDESGKRRRAMSLGISLLVYGALAGGLAVIAATASAVLPKEREVPVKFAELPPRIDVPEPEPEPPPPPRAKKANAAPRAEAARQDLGPPKQIPDEQPAEAEGELAEAGVTGPVDGFTDGGGGVEEKKPIVDEPPPESAPRQERLTVKKPVFRSGCAAPDLPLEVRKVLGAATVRVEVRLVIDSEGRVANATVTSGHPEIPEALILACARDQSFAPAELPGGPAVPYPFMRRFVFRPQSL
jgi:hypothetical protein